MTRVAAYCRVSTDKTDQLHSFISQKSFFISYIGSRPDWLLTEIYADEGITGTTTADRTGFLKMISDASSGSFDILLTKEVSRFSRNILDAISYTRRLKEMGIGVIFLNDGISTLEADAELRLGIMAAVAQEESRKTSERVKWGQKIKMEHGVVFGGSLLGYDVRNGQISVEPEGAETVRRIFGMYLHERKGVRAIAQALTESSTPTKTGRSMWSGAAVLKIIRNEKYCGDLVQKKTVTTDFLTHKKKKNHPENFIYIRDHHEPIITRAEWEEAQAERCRRTSSTPEVQSKGNRYALSGKIRCAFCGATYLCRTRKRKDGGAYRVWSCFRCACRPKRRQLCEDDIVLYVRKIIASIEKERLTEGLSTVIAGVIKEQDGSVPAYEREIAALDRKKIKLIDAFLAGDVSRAEYTCLKAQYENELARLGVLLNGRVDSDSKSRAAVILQMISAMAAGDGADADFYLSLVNRLEVRSDMLLEVSLMHTNGKWTVEF